MSQLDLRPLPLALVLCLVLFLLLGQGRSSVSAQNNPAETPQERLFEAFRAVRNADLHSVSGSDIAQLSSQLNQAMDLLQQGNDNMSSELSAETESRALALQSAAQDEALRVRVLAYATAFLAAVISALGVTKADRIQQAIRRRFMRSGGP